eukprot:COSAG06_NODE_8395_length_2187_cov_18.666188_2_plen_108_part_00
MQMQEDYEKMGQASREDYEKMDQASQLGMALEMKLDVETELHVEAMLDDYCNQPDEKQREFTEYQGLLDAMVEQLPVCNRDNMRRMMDTLAQGSVERLRAASDAGSP